MYVAGGFDDCSEEVEKQPGRKRKSNPISSSAPKLAKGERRTSGRVRRVTERLREMIEAEREWGEAAGEEEADKEAEE